MKALLVALALAGLSPALANADVLPEPGERVAPRAEPTRSGCGRKPGGPAHDLAALAMACTFSLLFLAGRKKPSASKAS